MSSPALHPARPWFVLLLAIVVAVAAAGWFWGAAPAGYLLALSCAGLGVTRALAPAGSVGPLAVRSRTLDVALVLGLAGALALLTYALPSYV